jgi:hypothetical protein
MTSNQFSQELSGPFLTYKLGGGGGGAPPPPPPPPRKKNE